MRRSVILIVITGVTFALLCCTPFRDAKHNRQVKDLRSIASVGDNIYSVKKKIEGRYHYVSDVYDPTELGDKLWMNISFGLEPSNLETFSYVTGIKIPFASNDGLGALIEADSAGIIRKIK